MAANYNQALRELARAQRVSVIDLDRWSREAFPDPEHWCFVSVHLKAEGQVRVGEYLAHELIPILDSLSGTKNSLHTR